jgi:hypothetical protein
MSLMRISSVWSLARRPQVWAWGLALAFTACKDYSEVPPVEAGTDYYPIAVGNVRTFAVADTIWDGGAATISKYRFRETITGQFTDIAGQTSYRVVRAKSVGTAPFVDDSVMVLTPSARTVTLNRDNRRSVELVFPVREDRVWNLSAYSNTTPDDTITNITRRYYQVGQPLRLAVPGLPVFTYAQTLTTLDEGNAAEDDAYYLRQYQQVFAKGIGPVLRNRRRYYYCDTNPNCQPTPSYIFAGHSRHETLIDFVP